MLRKTWFQIDGLEGKFEGYTKGQFWNGWAVPYFTNEVADEIMEAMSNDTNNVVQYHPRLDAYLVYLEGSDEIEEYPACEEIDDEALYSIGGGSWTWEEDTEEDEDEDEPSKLSELKSFVAHVEKVAEGITFVNGYAKFVPDVKIVLAGKSIDIPLCADTFDALVALLENEIKEGGY